MGPGHTLSPCSKETKVGTEVLYEGEYENVLYLEPISSCGSETVLECHPLLLLTVVTWDAGQ